MSEFDAVLVPGGGVREGGALPPWVESRLDKALELAGGAPIITLSAGTPHKASPLDHAGRPIFESVAGTRYLLRRGYPAHLLLTETCSYDTIGNAYFARVIHTGPAGYRHLLIVTSRFHMPRTEAVFRWIFSLPPLPTPYRLEFVDVPDVGMTPEVSAARRVKEQASLDTLGALAVQYQTLSSLHRWLFSGHAAYSVEGPVPANPGDPKLLKSY